MDANTLMSLAEAARRLQVRNALVRGLLISCMVPHRRVGRAIAIDADGFARLQCAVAAWRSRPRPYSQKLAADATR